MKEKERFSVIARIRSSNHAWRGIKILFSTCHNAWGHLFFGLLALYLGCILNISNLEWVLIIFSIGLVLIAEAFNTALEIDMDLTSPGYHQSARDAKDVAAAAVLMSVILSVVVAIFIFAPKILYSYSLSLQ